MQKTKPQNHHIQEVWQTYLCSEHYYQLAKKYKKPSFSEAIYSFASLESASLAAIRTLLQSLLACLNVALDLEDLVYWCKQNKLFLWDIAAEQEV